MNICMCTQNSRAAHHARANSSFKHVFCFDVKALAGAAGWRCSFKVSARGKTEKPFVGTGADSGRVA